MGFETYFCCKQIRWHDRSKPPYGIWNSAESTSKYPKNSVRNLPMGFETLRVLHSEEDALSSKPPYGIWNSSFQSRAAIYILCSKPPYGIWNQKNTIFLGVSQVSSKPPYGIWNPALADGGGRPKTFETSLWDLKRERKVVLVIWLRVRNLPMGFETVLWAIQLAGGGKFETSLWDLKHSIDLTSIIDDITVRNLPMGFETLSYRLLFLIFAFETSLWDLKLMAIFSSAFMESIMFETSLWDLKPRRTSTHTAV